MRLWRGFEYGQGGGLSGFQKSTQSKKGNTRVRVRLNFKLYVVNNVDL